MTSPLVPPPCVLCAVIADFGFARQFGTGEAPKTCIGTAAYVAPEVLSLAPYDGAKVDAWACGVVLFLMLTGEYPFGVGNACGVGRKGDPKLKARLEHGWGAARLRDEVTNKCAPHPSFPRSLSPPCLRCTLANGFLRGVSNSATRVVLGGSELPFTVAASRSG